MKESKLLESKNMRRFWRYCSKFRKRSRFVDSFPIAINGSTIIDDLDKAEHFNVYFCSNFSVDNNVQAFAHNRNVNSLDIITFSVLKVFNLLQKLPISYCSGPDGISQIVVQKLFAVLAIPLHYFYRKFIA